MARSKNRRGSGAAPDTVVVAYLRDVGNTPRGTVREMLREQAAKLSRVPDRRRPRVYVAEKARAQQLADFYGSPVEWLTLAAEESPEVSQPPPLVDDGAADLDEPAPRATQLRAARPPAVEGAQSDAVAPQSRRRRGAGASRRKAAPVSDEELFDDGPSAPEETGRVSAADSPADDGEPDPTA